MKKHAARASPSKQKTAVRHAAPPQQSESLPYRKPFGQEESDEDDDVDDAEMMADDAGKSDDDALMIEQDMAGDAQADTQDIGMEDDERLQFAPISAAALASSQASMDHRIRSQLRKVPIPPHRMSPLKRDWPKIYTPLVEQAGLMVRMNVRTRTVEIKSSKHTEDLGVLQKACDFVKAYALGFDADDALALLRLDDLYVDSFEMKDVKTLHGDHLSRAIGRIAGKDGRTRFAIENASRTRIVLADTKIHILGAFQNIRMAKDSIVALIMGSPPGKVYAKLRTVSARMRQRA